MKKKGFSRRDFLKSGALLGSSLLTASCAPSMKAEGEYELAMPENILYTACLQCNTGCGAKVKVLNGIATKIDGNPYNPFALIPHLKYKTDPQAAAKIDSPLCPKGQAGIQTVYDPYRIIK